LGVGGPGRTWTLFRRAVEAGPPGSLDVLHDAKRKVIHRVESSTQLLIPAPGLLLNLCTYPAVASRHQTAPTLATTFMFGSFVLMSYLHIHAVNGSAWIRASFSYPEMIIVSGRGTGDRHTAVRLLAYVIATVGFGLKSETK
jgi:hypothetical protein